MKKIISILKVLFFITCGVLIILLVLIFILSRSQKPGTSAGRVGTIAPMINEYASTTYYEIKLQYPESSSSSLPEIAALVGSQESQFMSDVDQASATTESQAINFANGGPWSFYIDTRVATSSKTTSYILDIYNYEGGAHGVTDVYAFTYDNSGRKLLAQSDVLKNASSTYSTLSTLARAYFNKKFPDGEAFNLNAGTLPEPDTFSTWYLSGSDIVFVFGQYTIGPYVLGIQEFPVATSSIPTLLTGNY